MMDSISVENVMNVSFASRGGLIMQKIAKKLVEIMKEVSYIEKKGRNTFHNYSYATSADVLEKINQALVKHNLCSVVLSELLRMDEVTTAKGNIEHLATVKVDVMLIDGDSGETVNFIGLGSGQDSGDKAIMKAQTAGIKYAYMMSFAIATGDDPEADSNTDESNVIHEENRVKSTKNKATTNNVVANEYLCKNCKDRLTEKVYRYSLSKHGVPLCMKCQKLNGGCNVA